MTSLQTGDALRLGTWLLAESAAAHGPRSMHRGEGPGVGEGAALGAEQLEAIPCPTSGAKTLANREYALEANLTVGQNLGGVP